MSVHDILSVFVSQCVGICVGICTCIYMCVYTYCLHKHAYFQAIVCINVDHNVGICVKIDYSV